MTKFDELFKDKKVKENLHAVGIRMSESTYKILKEYSTKYKVGVSSIINKIIEDYIKE